jgi:hypothetical protein
VEIIAPLTQDGIRELTDLICGSLSQTARGLAEDAIAFHDVRRGEEASSAARRVDLALAAHVTFRTLVRWIPTRRRA